MLRELLHGTVLAVLQQVPRGQHHWRLGRDARGVELISARCCLASSLWMSGQLTREHFLVMVVAVGSNARTPDTGLALGLCCPHPSSRGKAAGILKSCML